MFKAVTDSLLSLIYPQTCRLCLNSVDHADDGVVCGECWDATRIFRGAETLCARCGLFLGESDRPVETFCRKCDDHLYDSACAVGVYDKALAASVIELKRIPHISPRLQKLFISALAAAEFHDSTLIVPVPLSKKRLHERGFNQAAILARIAARHAKITLDESSLVRTVHTPMHRAAMDKKAREITVKNAFAVVRPKLIEGQNILLVDDIFTSGATASNCAKVLKKTGAGKVDVLTIARAV
jgi:ComF family protein